MSRTISFADKSRNCGSAVLFDCRRVGLHKLVTTIIVTLSAYILSVRLVGVMEVNNSVGQGCSTSFNQVFVDLVHINWSSNVEQNYPALWFLPV